MRSFLLSFITMVSPLVFANIIFLYFNNVNDVVYFPNLFTFKLPNC